METLFITKRSDGLVSLSDANGFHLGSFSNAEQAAKWARDNGYRTQDRTTGKIVWRNPSAEIQLSRFPDGGFVIHKISVDGASGRFSAWFDATGKLLDAEQLIGNRSRPVKRNGPIWEILKTVGGRHTARNPAGDYPSRLRSSVRQTFLNDADDVKWLRETHLKDKNLNNGPVPPFKSFVLIGNEDSPNELLLYREKHPTVDDKPTRATLMDNGHYSLAKVI